MNPIRTLDRPTRPGRFDAAPALYALLAAGAVLAVAAHVLRWVGGL